MFEITLYTLHSTPSNSSDSFDISDDQIMTRVIVFSGNSNTGKTTAIHFLQEFLRTQQPDKKVILFEETAREYIDAHGGGDVESIYDFQKYIYQREFERMDRLKEIVADQTYDYVFIDRTTIDCLIYSFWHTINCNIASLDFVVNNNELIARSQQLYTYVVFFSTPIHADKRFAHYNNEMINTIFEQMIKGCYGDKVLTYTNNIFFQDNMESTIFNQLIL